MSKSTIITKQLSSLIDKKLIDSLVKESSLVQRQRKIEIPKLIWALILSSSHQASRSVAGVARSYTELTGESVARSSIYSRLNKGCAQLLKRLTLNLINTLAANEEHSAQDQRDLIQNLRARFDGVYALDSSSNRLRDKLKNKLPGVSTPAGLKLHSFFNVLSGKLIKVKKSKGRTADLKACQLGGWLGDSLLLIDLGYFSYNFFDRIERNGGYFLSRLKSNSTPKIVCNHRDKTRGNSINVEGMTLKQALKKIKRGVLDVDVEMTFKRRCYKGKRSSVKRRFRVISIYNATEKRYHSYVTNLPVDKLSAEEATSVYALRWQIEIFFKALRQHHSFGDFPSGNEAIVDCFFWASILSYLVSYECRERVSQELPSYSSVPMIRWSQHFCSYFRDFIRASLNPKAKYMRDIADWAYKLLLTFIRDPNTKNRQRISSTNTIIYA